MNQKFFKLFFMLALISMSIQAQEKQIKGTILDETGIGLPGCSILVKGTTIGTDSNFDGNYSINAKKDDILVISFMGYFTKEIVISNQSIINVTLQPNISALDEVVVVGFGTQKKTNLTGAVSSIKMEDVLGDRPVTNTLQAVQGTVPGLQITTNSGQPGAEGLGVNIRGMTSINGGSALVLVDNVPVSIENINPQDVESVTVLKDAAATSIYGARAAFGVILITTKKSIANQPIKFNYSSTYSFSSPEDIPEKASTYDFVNALNDWGVTDYWTGQNIPTWVNFLEDYKINPGNFENGYGEFEGLRYPLVDTDVIGAFLNENGFTQIHNLNFGGGSEKTTYRISAGYSNEDGVIVTDNDSNKKFSFNANLNTHLTNNLTSNTNISYRNSTRKSPIGDYGRAIDYGPYVPAEGNHVFDDGTEVPYQTPANMERLKMAPETLTDNIRLFEKVEFKPIKEWSIAGEFTFEKGNTDIYTSDNQVLTVNPERYTLNGVDPELTYYRKYNNKFTYKALNLYSKYEKSIDNHNFSVLVGLNKESRESESFWVKKTNLISVGLPSIATATGVLTSDESFGEWAVMGYFGRLNYNFKEKYFIEANGRYDGSSKFAEGDKFGFFPSFSGGWNLSKENFMQNIESLNLLKLRASWGEIGNQNTSSLYPAIPGMPAYDAPWINHDTGLKYVSLGVPNLVSSSFTWEKVATTNFGVDARLFSNKFSTSFDVFTRNTIGMLAPGAELPAVIGANAPLQNVADLQSKGWEFEMSWKDHINEFSYNIGVTLFDSKAEITKFDNEAGLLSQYYVGREIGEIWGYVSDGFYEVEDFVEGSLDENLRNGTLKEGIPAFKGRTQNPGDTKFKDLDGDGQIYSGNNTLYAEYDEEGNMIPNTGPGDRKIIGNSQRRFQYGISGNATYKNFDFSMLLNGVGKRDIYMNNSVRFPYTGEFNVVYKDQLDYWTPENTDAYFPRNYPLAGVNYGLSRTTQTKYLLSGAYLRVKNVTLGYSLPKQILDKANIDKLRIYISGENIYSFDNLPDGINTELANKGNGATYPYMKSFNVGLNLSF